MKIQGDGVSLETVHRLLDELPKPNFCAGLEARQKLRALVPEYRLIAEQVPALCRTAGKTEMMGAYLLEFERTAGFLGRAR